MERETYIEDDIVCLVEYAKEDDADRYSNWLDEETISGYNIILRDTFEEYAGRTVKQRFFASIMLKETREIIGQVGLSPENTPPDLAIWIYKQFRHSGYGTRAFGLGVRYCFETLKLGKLYAGCYAHNHASCKMLMKCGFEPNPSGNIEEKHCLTGEPITQYDYVIYNPYTSY